MRASKKAVIAVGFCGALSALLAMGQQPQLVTPQASAEVSVLMRAKLSSSQKVVEGLMAGDMSMIRKGAVDLQKICDSNSWRGGDDQVAGHYRSDLRRASIKLAAMADADNLDGAAYTYMHMLTTCINCHDYSRNVLRVASVKQPGKVIRIPVTEEESLPYHDIFR
jgi:hypothetical protein